jgi:Delta7-sterol 5-desaturase
MTPEQKLAMSFKAAQGVAIGDAVWYLAMACGTWVLLYLVFRRLMSHRKISGRWPRAGQISREIWHSLRSLVIYGLVAMPITYAAWSGWTRMYRHIDDYGMTWYVTSILLMIVIHDAYFYWTHRAMHHRWLYRWMHRTHHLSTDPTPWAAYAFSATEAAVQAGIAPLILFTIPVHPSAFALFMIWQISFNVMGHCGCEIFPSWFLRTPLGYFLNSPTHHALHHEKFRGNFGLYFNVWDRLLGTNFSDYEARFEQATGAMPQTIATAKKNPAATASSR